MTTNDKQFLLLFALWLFASVIAIWRDNKEVKQKEYDDMYWEDKIMARQLMHHSLCSCEICKGIK